MKINCFGTFDSTGFGRIGHEFVYLLHQQGVEVKIVDPLQEWEGNSPPNPLIKKEILSLRGRFEDPDLIYNIYPPNGWRLDSKRPSVGEFLFECSEMPLMWVEHIRQFDQIWVPNQFCNSVCWNSGIELNKVKVLPYGLIDWGISEKIKIDDGPVFLLIGEWNERKNLEAAIKKIDESELEGKFLVKTFFRDFKLPNHQRTNEILLRRVVKRLRLKHLDRFIFNIDHFDSLKIEKLFNSVDCLIIPSHGEGFCRPFFEAGLKGVPSIVSDIPPMNEIHWKSKFAFPIECNGLEKAQINPNLPYAIWYRGLDWFSINLESMIDQIKFVLENPDEARARGKEMQELCQTLFDPIKRTEDRIKSLEELI